MSPPQLRKLSSLWQERACLWVWPVVVEVGAFLHLHASRRETKSKKETLLGKRFFFFFFFPGPTNKTHTGHCSHVLRRLAL